MFRGWKSFPRGWRGECQDPSFRFLFIGCVSKFKPSHIAEKGQGHVSEVEMGAGLLGIRVIKCFRSCPLSQRIALTTLVSIDDVDTLGWNFVRSTMHMHHRSRPNGLLVLPQVEDLVVPFIDVEYSDISWHYSPFFCEWVSWFRLPTRQTLTTEKHTMDVCFAFRFRLLRCRCDIGGSNVTSKQGLPGHELSGVIERGVCTHYGDLVWVSEGVFAGTFGGTKLSKAQSTTPNVVNGSPKLP